MKSFWSFAAKALLVVVLLQAWFLYDMYRQNTALTALNDEYAIYLKDSEEEIAALQTQLTEMEKKTVDGILKETNKAVVQGWESLLNKVEQELEKAKQAVPELLERNTDREDQASSESDSVMPESDNAPDNTTDDITNKEQNAEGQSNGEQNNEENNGGQPSGDNPEQNIEPNTPPVLIPGEVT